MPHFQKKKSNHLPSTKKNKKTPAMEHRASVVQHTAQPEEEIPLPVAGLAAPKAWLVRPVELMWKHLQIMARKNDGWYCAGWWLNQPLWKIFVKMGSSSLNRGENKKYLKPPPR